MYIYNIYIYIIFIISSSRVIPKMSSPGLGGGPQRAGAQGAVGAEPTAGKAGARRRASGRGRGGLVGSQW